MSDHDHPDHEHELTCLNLEGLSVAAVQCAEEALQRPVHYIHFYVDSKDGNVAVATDIPAEHFAAAIERIAQATRDGAYGMVRLNGETAQ